MTAPSTRAPLTPESLFAIVCNEAMRDGSLEDWEAKVLQALARFLGIAGQQAEAMARDAQRRFHEGRLGPARPMDPRALYQKVLYYSAVDGRVTGDEGAMLGALRKLFRVDDATDQALRRQLAAHFRRQGATPSVPAAPPAAPDDGPTPPPDSPPVAAAPSAPSPPPPAALARQILHRARAGHATPEQAAAEAEALLVLWESEAPGDAPYPIEALAELAPVLAVGRRSKALTATLAALLPAPQRWAPATSELNRVFAGWAHAVSSRNLDDEVVGLAETFWGLVQLAPADARPWGAWGAGTAELLRGLATRRNWDLHGPMLRRFDQVPDEGVVQIAAAWARSGADWLVLGLHAGVEYSVDRGLQELKRMAHFRDQAQVRQAEAAALACLIEVASEEASVLAPRLAPSLTRLLELAGAYSGDLQVVRHLGVVCLDAGRALLAIGDVGSCLALLEGLRAAAPTLASAAASLDEAARNAGRLARLRARTMLDGNDAVVLAAQGLLDALRQHAPESAGVEEAARRLAQVRGGLRGRGPEAN